MMLAAVAAAAFVLLSERAAILADSPGATPVATTTPLVITEDTMRLLPPFDPQAIATMAPPPCVERYRNKYRQYRYITLGWGIYIIDGCSLIGPDGQVLSEAEADELVVEREAARLRSEAEAPDIDAGDQPWARAIRELELLDGSKIKLPSDVRVVDYIISRGQCLRPELFCSIPPYHKLERGDSVIWVDSNGVGFSHWSDDEEIDPDAFPFLTRIEIER